VKGEEERQLKKNEERREGRRDDERVWCSRSKGWALFVDSERSVGDRAGAWNEGEGWVKSTSSQERRSEGDDAPSS